MNFTTFLALIEIGLPVWGLRPFLALRCDPLFTFIKVKPSSSSEGLDEILQQWPFFFRFTDKLGHEFIEKVYKRSTDRQTPYGHQRAHPKYCQPGTGKGIQNPFGDRTINIVIEDTVKAHED